MFSVNLECHLRHNLYRGKTNMRVQWNLSRKMKGIRNSDVLVISIGKSGRTWLRVMINKYISLAYDVPVSLDDIGSQNNNIPSILYTHEMWTHYGGTFREKITGKYVVPDNILSTKKTVLLYRDPRDVIVSLYFHLLRRRSLRTRRKWHKKSHHLTVMDLVAGKKEQMHRQVQVLNGWRKRLEDHTDCLWMSYEELMENTTKKFMEVLRHIDFDIIDQGIAEKAIEFAQFENMKKMERENFFEDKRLRPANPSDPDSYHVRKGEVGGYTNYFNEEELRYLNSTIADLDPFFDYNTSSD